jgi:hypothetical protein
MINFREKQYMRIPVLWAVLLGVGILLLYGNYRQIVRGEMFGNQPMSDIGLIIFTTIYFVFIFAFSRTNLLVEVGEEGVLFRYYPFHLKYKKIAFNEIETAEIREFKPLAEFGGWGIRGNSKSSAYTVSGKKCVEFHLKGKKSILIGTLRQDEFAKALRSAGVLVSHTDFHK